MALRLALLFRSLPFLCLLAFTTHRATAQTRNIALRVTQTLEEKEKSKVKSPTRTPRFIVGATLCPSRGKHDEL